MTDRPEDKEKPPKIPVIYALVFFIIATLLAIYIA